MLPQEVDNTFLSTFALGCVSVNQLDDKLDVIIGIVFKFLIEPQTGNNRKDPISSFYPQQILIKCVKV